jgi:hypothetical protein
MKRSPTFTADGVSGFGMRSPAGLRLAWHQLRYDSFSSTKTIQSMQLGAELATFIQGGVAIDLGTRDQRNVPRVARAGACRVTTDRNRVTVFAANRINRRFIDALAQSRTIAAVFCLASTHRAVQIKGFDAVIESDSEVDLALIERAVSAFVSDIITIGFTEEQARADVGVLSSPGEIIAISFTPEAIFEQTPGPRAGMPF